MNYHRILYKIDVFMGIMTKLPIQNILRDG